MCSAAVSPRVGQPIAFCGTSRFHMVFAQCTASLGMPVVPELWVISEGSRGWSRTGAAARRPAYSARGGTGVPGAGVVRR